ncbi:Protease inhibitor Inh [Cohaesibacter sp. ES.047]|uniref:AprI/Inh family metalloprotease inhibitor n=1 Tax=Cohaesibacter sp. ES.047 TaxID=1798205 RepID=UPI000BB96241|nr:AprI/Inh family metalloprotease inhibitor [Cohaesibacter sp. ES.047]SNY93694.1 Protease inhibitor Inh [Cohaesibacter sp. ES.047]
MLSPAWLITTISRSIPRVRFFILSLLLGLIHASSAQAQSTNAIAQAFKGQWVTYDRSFAADTGLCTLTFSATRKGEIYPISQSNCTGEITSIVGWSIVKNQLVFVDQDNKPLAKVGGNQGRLSGTMTQNNKPVIFENAKIAKKINAARESISCAYVGYSQICAKPQEFSPPPVSPGAETPIKILVNLNARVEPRNDAEAVATLKPQSCAQALTCSRASDGLWCKIKHENKQLWIKKQAVRLKKYPIITFQNGCS